MHKRGKDKGALFLGVHHVDRYAAHPALGCNQAVHIVVVRGSDDEGEFLPDIPRPESPMDPSDTR